MVTWDTDWDIDLGVSWKSGNIDMEGKPVEWGNHASGL